MRYQTAAALAFTLAASGPGPASANPIPAHSAEESPEGRRAYQAGVDFYNKGDLEAALTSFRNALRLEPNNRSARAAVWRLESETSVRRVAPGPPAAFAQRYTIAAALDRFFLITIPRWYYFERTLGNGLRDVGTLNAQNALVIQLLGEKKVAHALRSPFKKDREVRALIRRAAVAAQGLEQA